MSSNKLTEADIAGLDYHHHEFRASYQDIMNLLVNVEILNRCITACANVPFPEDTSCPSYLDFAERIQTYFLNSQALHEMLTTTKGYTNERSDVSDEFKAMVIFAKVIRNKVAHEGVWIPYATRGVVKDKGRFKFFALPKANLKKMIIEASIRDKQKAVNAFKIGSSNDESEMQKLVDLDNQLIDLIKRSNDWTEEALKYLDAHYSGEFEVHNFMLNHYRIFVPWVIRHFERRTREQKVKQVSELRRKANIKTLDEKLEACKQLYQEFTTQTNADHKS
ncbi:hypothetical protein [Rheinheimera sp.]|uniref:hypothetical protein n=1 Tax=Rheinheimera sp. TaxID=1869214 RepID=UPI0027335151|nr:hypothetical protein [Rheinheimera sp.]MDP2717082.1 hypothetical protein [Rheinheimera sp.]